MDDSALAPGTRLGRYEIVQRLATGGMAEIYLARMSGPAGFAKHVVLKRILPIHAQNDEFVRMFHNEARYAATLDHPNIAHVYDLGEDRGLHYYTMEYLHGDDCRALVRAAVSRRRPIPLADALAIVIGACNGCHYAHEMTDEDGRPLGLVHRDISPANVVVTYAGAIKIVDFGIAKATNVEAVTAGGGTKGKLAYMAPEQGRSEPLDRRADVYALGVLLYELTTLRRAFVGEFEARILWSVISGDWQRPSEVVPDFPPALEAIIVKAMALDRADRHATARELQQALEGFARAAGLAPSASGLGELLTSLIGAKVEPWRERPERGERGEPTPLPTRAATVDPDADPLAPTFMPPSTAPRPRDAASSSTKLAGPSAPSAPVRPAGGRGGWIAAGVLGLGGAAALAYVLWSGARAEDPPVMVVAERGSAVVETIDAGPAASPADAAAAVRPMDAASASPPVDAAARRPPRTVKPAAGDPLSSAFARRTPLVSACFARDPSAVMPQGGLVLRFALDTAGAPTEVDLQPVELARTAAGACILDVARGTRFPAQPEPVTFRIPVAVRTSGGGR
jgi:serine/threonine protein kinase